MKQSIFLPAEIYLPEQSAYPLWSVVACDQYTSDPAYWHTVETLVGNAPSALKITFPELYLQSPDRDARIQAITETMKAYRNSVLKKADAGMIYVERTMKNGKIRHGIVGMFDLEAYDYNKGSVSPIRATEGTVLSRIPPRVAIRKNAVLELPHVMVLTDDPDNRIFEAAKAAKHAEPLYDFDLMQNGGHIAGWPVSGDILSAVDTAVAERCDPAAFHAQYGEDRAPLCFAIGDGNHSLATAKACYEALKEEIGEAAARQHPARYALAELVNLHDDALEFEPIYRVVFGVRPKELLEELYRAFPGCTELPSDAVLTMSADAHDFRCLTAEGTVCFRIPHPAAQLPVGTLQSFLDAYLAAHPEADIDYIHGEDAVRSLTEKPDAVGFLFCGMGKEDLFRTVIYDGALPRKTFSMGEADEKRYYLECRAIR